MGKEKVVYFLPLRVGFQVIFLEISQRRHVRDVITTQYVGLQVTITVTCLNFAVTGSRILLHPLSLSRKGKPSRKIALNCNGEVNCRELARRPWLDNIILLSYSITHQHVLWYMMTVTIVN